jgi:hypothetical protein
MCETGQARSLLIYAANAHVLGLERIVERVPGPILSRHRTVLLHYACVFRLICAFAEKRGSTEAFFGGINPGAAPDVGKRSSHTVIIEDT